MDINENDLRASLTKAMAEAVDEAESYEAYFGTPAENMDYGAARADGTLPADMMFLWEFAGYITNYVAGHGIDMLDIVERVGNLFVAYQAVKGGTSDFDETEKSQIKKAVADTLKALASDGKK